MHACCQLEVTRHDRETSLIVRDLPSSGNAKVQIVGNVLSDLTYSRTATYAEITPVQTLLVTDYHVTGKVLAMCKPFPIANSVPLRRKAQLSDFPSRFTSRRCACARMPGRPDHPARSSRPYS